MYIDKENFVAWMERIMDRFDMQERKIDRLLSEHNYLNGEKLLDNQDLCFMLKVSTKTLQRYRKLERKLVNTSLFLSTCMNSPPCVGDTVCKLPSLSKPLTALTLPCCLSKTSSTSFSCPSVGGVILFAINNWNFSGYGNSPTQR